MTSEEAIAQLRDCVQKLADIGFNIKNTDITHVIVSDSLQGLGCTIINNPHSYIIKLHPKQLQKTETLLSTIYHELCHVIQFNEAFDAHIISIDEKTDCIIANSGQETIAWNTIFDNFSHTELWLDIVQDVLTRLHLNIKISAYVSEVDLDEFLKGTFMQNKQKNYSMSRIHIDKEIVVPPVEAFKAEIPNKKSKHNVLFEVAGSKPDYSAYFKTESIADRKEKANE